MIATLSRTAWLGISAWSLESPDLRVVTVPDMGAKIVLYFRQTGGA